MSKCSGKQSAACQEGGNHTKQLTSESTPKQLIGDLLLYHLNFSFVIKMSNTLIPPRAKLKEHGRVPVGVPYIRMWGTYDECYI